MRLSCALLAIKLGLSGCWAYSEPGYRGTKRPHFDGLRFRNLQPIEQHGLSDFVRWQRTRNPGLWRSPTEHQRTHRPGPTPPIRVAAGELRVTYINHASLLIQLDNANLLSDPIYSERCSPLSWIGPRRVRPPGIPFEALPPIDFVIISHNHYDHLDLPTLKRLERTFSPVFFVGLGNAQLLRRHGISKVVELDWWQGYRLNRRLALHAVPAQHFSGRGLFDRNTTLWAGYVIESPAGAVYFAGDTGWGEHFAEIGRRFRPLRAALLPIGAFAPRWFMKGVHLSPEEALRAHHRLGAATSVAMHYGTFPLADDGETEAVQRLRKALASDPKKPDFWVLPFGAGRALPPTEHPNNTGRTAAHQ